MEFWSSCVIELSAEPAEGLPVPSGPGPHLHAQAPHATYKKFLVFLKIYLKCKIRKHVKSLLKMHKSINCH